jgi:hypothetical protein
MRVYAYRHVLGLKSLAAAACCLALVVANDAPDRSIAINSTGRLVDLFIATELGCSAAVAVAPFRAANVKGAVIQLDIVSAIRAWVTL